MTEVTENSLHALKNRIRGAARARDFDKVSQLWQELMSAESSLDREFYYEIADEVSGRGDKPKAGELLFDLVEKVGEQDGDREAFNLLRKIAKLSPELPGLREQLLSRYRANYAGAPGLESALTRSGLAVDGRVDKAVKLLDDAFYFTVGDFVRHDRGWGIGEIVDAEPENGEFIIDFHEKTGHRMGADMARKALVRVDSEGFEVLLWRYPDRVRELSEDQPLELLRKALRTRPKWVARDLRDALSGDDKPLTKKEWTKFWAKARRNARQDPWIEIGPSPKCQMSLREEPLSREDEVENKIQIAKNFDARLKIATTELSNVVDAIKRRAADAEDDVMVPAWVAPSLIALEKDLGRRAKDKNKPLAGRIEFEMLKAKVAAVFPQIATDLRLKIIDPDAIDVADPTSQAVKKMLTENAAADPTAGDPTAAADPTAVADPTAADPTAADPTAADPTMDPTAADPTMDPTADPTMDPTADPSAGPAEAADAKKAPAKAKTGSLSKKVLTQGIIDAIQACEDINAVAKLIVTDGFRRRFVRVLRYAHPDHWVEALTELLLEPPIGLFDVIATEMIDHGAVEAFQNVVEQVYVKPREFPIALTSLTRIHFQGKFKENLPERSDFEVFDKQLRVFDAAYLRYKGATDKKVKAREKALFEFAKSVLSEKSIGAIKKVLTEATEDQARRVLFLVRQSPAVTRAINTNVEKILANTYPKLLAAKQGRDKEEADTGYTLTTRAGLARKQEELRHLKEVELRENSKDIGAALALGDISENSELDAAYQRRELLTKKIQQLETELSRVGIIEFKKLTGKKVEVGCRVKIKNHDSGETSEFVILGPWDTDEAKGYISYLSAIAQGILGSAKGDKVKVQLPESKAPTIFEVLDIKAVTAESI